MHTKNTNKLSKNIFWLENVWQKETCQSFIQKMETIGFEEAMVQVGFGKQHLSRTRRQRKILALGIAAGLI